MTSNINDDLSPEQAILNKIKKTKPTGLENTQEPSIDISKFDELSGLVKEEVGHLDFEMLGELIYQLDIDQYEHIPVDIQTFIKDDYYLGNVIGKTIYPLWVDTLKKIYPTPFFSPYSEVIISSSIGSGKSLCGDTRIITDKGIVKIKNIVQNEQIQSETGMKPINQIFDNGFIKTKKLKFYTGKEIVASYDHKFRVLDTDGIIKWKKVNDMVVGDMVISQLKQHILCDKKLDTGLGYFLGCISGDGHVIHTNKDNLGVNIGMTIGHQIYNTEPNFINEFTELFTKYIGKFNYSWFKGSVTCNKTNKEFGQYLLNQRFYESKDVYLKRVPECIFESSKEDILDYLAGLIDTDGYISKSIEIAFKHEPFAQDVQILLSSLGVYSRIKAKYNKRFDKTYYIMDINRMQSYQNLKDLNLRISYKRNAFNKLFEKTVNMNTRVIYPYLKDYLKPTLGSLKTKYGNGKPFAKHTIEQINEFGNKRYSVNKNLFAIYDVKTNDNVTLETLQQLKEIYGSEFSTETTDYLIEHQVMLDELVSIVECEEETHVYDIEVLEDHSYLVNGLVSHNSTMSTVGLVYDIYKVLCLKDPQRYFGLMSDTKIVFMMFSATKALAQGVNYEYLENFFANSPFFQDNVNLPKGKSSVFDKGIELSKNIYVEIGSQIRHALGKAVFGAVLDEANFQNENSNQAEQTYTGILRRMQSRFQGGGGIIPGTLYVMSSPKNANSFLEDRIVKAKNINTSFVLDNVPIWYVKNHILNMYCGKLFKVFMGSDTLDPFIINDKIDNTSEILDNCIEVPVEYLESFTKDLNTSINDIAGRRTGSVLNLFKSKQKIIDFMIIPNEQRFSQHIIQLSQFDDVDTLMKYANIDYFKKPYKKHCFRYVHIDLAKNRDRTGIGCVFAEEIETVINQEQKLPTDFNFDDKESLDYLYSGNNSLSTRIKERMYYVDWVICLQNKQGEEVPFDKVVDFLKFLTSIGYPIKVVTTDGYQGDYLRQRLITKGLTAEYLSVSSKRNKQGRSYFINFKDVVQSQKIISVAHSVLQKELIELIDDGEVVTHPQISPTGGEGHDDVAQGVVGAFTKCFQSNVIQSGSSIIQYVNNKNAISGSNNNNMTTVNEQIKNATKQDIVNAISKKFYIKKYY